MVLITPNLFKLLLRILINKFVNINLIINIYVNALYKYSRIDKLLNLYIYI